MLLLTTVDVLSRLRFDVERSSTVRQIGVALDVSARRAASVPGVGGRHG